jgi:hypothetical protein
MPDAPKVNPFAEDWRPILSRVLKAAGLHREHDAYHRSILTESKWLAEALNAEYPGKRLKELSTEELEAFVQKAAKRGRDSGRFNPPT